MTLWQMIEAGGFVMIILLILSVITLTMIAYNFITINEKRLIPENFAEDILQNLKKKDKMAVLEMSKGKQNIIATILQAGFEGQRRGASFVTEAMEKRAHKEIARLWRNISYLSDIATIAPLIGLLGTVLGMIQAFNVIAFQTAVVKPILLAGGISKAMVTTAGGLIVAIPALTFYSFFRGRLQEITTAIEDYTTEIVKFFYVK
jgi:biopolymer transport protein ExbB